MLIERKSRWARTYFWSLEVLEQFTTVYHSDLRDRTNLCHFFRIIFVYMPLALICNLLFWGVVLFLSFVSPILFYGTWIAVLWQWGIILGLVGLIWAVVLMRDKLTERRHKQGWEAKKEVKKEKPKVLREWLKAKKDKVCPLVEFVDSKEEGDEQCAN